MRKHDRRSPREIIKELAKNNSTLREVVAKSKEEIGFLDDESRVLKETLARSGECSSAGRRENCSQRREPVIKSRCDDASKTDAEYDQEVQSRPRKKRSKRSEDADMGKKRKRHIILYSREGEYNDAMNWVGNSCDIPRRET